MNKKAWHIYISICPSNDLKWFGNPLCASSIWFSAPPAGVAASAAILASICARPEKSAVKRGSSDAWGPKGQGAECVQACGTFMGKQISCSTFRYYIVTYILFNSSMSLALRCSCGFGPQVQRFFCGSLLGSATPPSNLSPWSRRSTRPSCRKRSSCRVRMGHDYISDKYLFGPQHRNVCFIFNIWRWWFSKSKYRFWEA